VLFVALAAFAVLGVFAYRRRLRRREAAMMFVEVGERDLPRANAIASKGGSGGSSGASNGGKSGMAAVSSFASSVFAASKGRKIGDPTLVNTTASEVLRGPGVIPAGPMHASNAARGKAKPKLTVAMYRHTRNPSNGTSINYAAASPRLPDFGVDAPSPRRVTSFDCAPSPLPTDSRQRHAKYDYAADVNASPPLSAQALPRPAGAVVGHRRGLSRSSSVASSVHRMALYGAPTTAQRASHADSLLSIPVSTRYSFERNGETQDVHGTF